MKALLRDKYGSVDHLYIGETATPAPQRDQVLVRVRAASINDWDWGILQGGFNRVFGGLLRPKVILGCDIAGEVEAIGERVTQFKVGDHVYGDLCGEGFGAFAEYACVRERALVSMSPRMTFEQAAAIPQAAVLAIQALSVRPLQSGKKILVNGAGGGVGTFAIQLAKLHDVEVTGVDSAIKLDMLRSLGYDHVIDYNREDFTALGKRYDLIVDAKTNRHPMDYVRVLNPQGVYATVGGTRLFRVAVLGSWYGRNAGVTLKLVGLKPNRDLKYLNELFEAGKFKPVVDGPYRFVESDIHRAFQHFGTAQHQGKVVVTMT